MALKQLIAEDPFDHLDRVAAYLSLVLIKYSNFRATIAQFVHNRQPFAQKCGVRGTIFQ